MTLIIYIILLFILFNYLNKYDFNNKISIIIILLFVLFLINWISLKVLTFSLI
ncbi:hypothetical protein [Thomasclavelia spiroformis]|uniref:hypothetical protein n=1 Tax=Thomasclavelia spiroformis TaxID=29348 RepID=UPI003568339F